MQAPVFISGLRKSGTSLTKNLLDGHQSLFVYPPNEVKFFQYSPHNSIVGHDRRHIDDPSQLLDELSSTGSIDQLTNPQTSFYTEKFDKGQFRDSISQANPSDFREVYESLYNSMATACSHISDDISSLRPVSKTTLETEHFPYFQQWFPNSKFLYVVRNPYGHFVAARESLRLNNSKLGKYLPRLLGRVKKEGTWLTPVSDQYPAIAKEINRMNNSYYFAMKYSDLYPERFHILNFDELLRNPEKELQKLAEFLDIEYNEAMTNPTICGDPWRGNSWHQDEFEGIDKSPLDHWEEDITDGEIAIINNKFNEHFDKFGYNKLDTSWSWFKPLHRSEINPVTYLKNRALL